MRVLVIGSGGREHAIVRALARDPDVVEIHAAPGNPGIASVAALHPVDVLDPVDVSALASDLKVDLVVVGPEAPLVVGVADAVRASGIDCFGPSAKAAQLEGSKAFAKQVMAAAEVPTAMAYVCETEEEAANALDAFGSPYVVKDDGLAAGKGVVVTNDHAVALAHAKSCDRVVVEEYLDGPELSMFAVCDGVTVLPLQPAQDFKRLRDEDQGPNTGGMGAYSPLPWAPPGLVDEVCGRVLQPTIDEMAKRGTPFTGLLYAGLALTSRGVRVVEFNVRFGDPETQALLELLLTPLGNVLRSAARGRLAELEPLRWRNGAAVAVVLAADGYPDAPRRGDVITGLESVADIPDTYVLHAGTALDGSNLVTAGGRVLAVTAVANDLETARGRAYAGVREIRFDGAQHREDIARAAALSTSEPATAGV
jgi:phosphoribosylamine--glycine ligase